MKYIISESDIKKIVKRVLIQESGSVINESQLRDMLSNIYTNLKEQKDLYRELQPIRDQNKENQKKDEACIAKYKPFLNNAITKWKNWLNHPTTRRKWIANWCKGKFKDPNVCKNYNSIFKTYNDMLNDTTFDTFGYVKPVPSNVSTALAWAAGGEVHSHKDWGWLGRKIKIGLNCLKNDPNPLDIFIHEIQHILFHRHPINPKKQVQDVFNIKNDDYEKLRSTKTFQPNELQSLPNIKKNFPDQKEKQIYDYWNNVFSKSDYLKKDPGYACRVTEKESNIYSIRSLLGKNAGDNVTLEEIKPYIIRTKKLDTNVYWFLACWWSQGFPDMNIMLQKTNALAKNKNQLTNPKTAGNNNFV